MSDYRPTVILKIKIEYQVASKTAFMTKTFEYRTSNASNGIMVVCFGVSVHLKFRVHALRYTMAAPRIIAGNRGLRTENLVHNDFRYHLNQRRLTFLYWRCWRKNCRSALKTNVFDLDDENAVITIINDNNNHNHPVDNRSIAEADAVNAMKTAIVRQPTVPVKRIYDQTLVQIFQKAGVNGPPVPDFHAIRSSLCRTKAAQCPPIPQGIQDVRIAGAFAQTYLGERYLLELNNGEGVAIFTTDAQLATMANCTTIYVDGTFRTAPFPYRQVFTIHGEYMGRIVNLAAALLTGKSEHHYDVLFNVILRELQRVIGGAQLRVQLIVTDFELAVFNSVRNHFPNVTLGGCYFHFVKNLWKHIQDLGLSPAYNNDAPFKRCVRLCFSIGFLPLQMVVNNFFLLENSPMTQGLMATYANLRVFFTYVYDTYIVGNYPPETWNVFNRGMSVRTNNHVESYHAEWNRAVGVRHPSLWIFIARLQEREAKTRNNIMQANRGRPPATQRVKWRRMERSIVNLKTRFQNNQINIHHYWNAVTHVVADFDD